MLERRAELRNLCADLVELRFKDKNGRGRRLRANLEDISRLGAGLQVEHSVPLQTTVRICYGHGELTGTVRYCIQHETGYLIGIEFKEGHQWSEDRFRPLHLINPRDLRS